MFNFETTWRKNHRLEGEVLFYQNQAKRDASKIIQLQDIIKNLEIELTQEKATNYALRQQIENDIKTNKPTLIKLKTKKGTK